MVSESKVSDVRWCSLKTCRVPRSMYMPEIVISTEFTDILSRGNGPFATRRKFFRPHLRHPVEFDQLDFDLTV